MNPYPYSHKVRKSKALTVLLSMLFPGAGHLYLGLMPRGLAFMLLFILNIVMIVFAAQGNFPFHMALGDVRCFTAAGYISVEYF